MDTNTEEDFTDLYGDDDTFIGAGTASDSAAVSGPLLRYLPDR